MKKGKIFRTLAVVGACMCAPLVLSGCDKEAESKVSFRVEDGYIQVTEDGTNWKNLVDIDDLKGEPGQPGQPGQAVDGKQVEFNVSDTHIQWRYVGDDEWNDLIELEELEGTAGTNGATWHTGTTIPNSQIGKDGDLYLNTTTNVIYKHTNGGWLSIGNLAGDDGEDGNKWSTGTSLPNSTMGNYGDLFLNTNTFDVYEKKMQGGWTKICNIKATDGEDGNGWHSGEGQPNYLVGNTGDFYLDTTNYDIYEKTLSTTWTKIGNIKGENGESATTPEVVVTLDYNTPEAFIQNGLDFSTINNITSANLVPGCWLDEKLIDFAEYGLENYFQGWFIKETNKEIDKYTCIGGNIEIEARWDETKINSDFANTGVNFAYDSTLDSYKVSIKTSEQNIIVPKYYFTLENGLKPVLSIVSRSGSITAAQCRSIELPNGLKYIGDSAFAACSNLQQIEIPNTVVEIGKNAFNAAGITSLNIPNSVTKIGDRAFSACASLTEVIVPDSVEDLGSNIFRSSTNITSITMPYINVDVDGGTLFGINFYGGSNDSYPGTTPSGLVRISQSEVVYEDGVPCTNNMVFLVPISLKNVTITSGTIPVQAFNNFNYLEFIHICEDVTIAESSLYETFENCASLKSVVLDNEEIAQQLNQTNDYGMLTSNARNIYIPAGATASTWLSGAFTKQETSDIDGYDMYVRNAE